tara:strand:- start:513 stop:977 length:465 start_codon:yes stop_codon:yes gene_type:complete
MNVFTRYHKKLIFLIILFILNACKLQEPYNNHGIVNLAKRSDLITINKSNKNDVIKLVGSPHTVSIDNNDEWIYFERVLTKGEFHKLGQNILKENNVLFLKFNKFGIVEDKKLIGKDSKNKLTFSENTTENTLTQKSFVQKFLSSLRNKMYNKK